MKISRTKQKEKYVGIARALFAYAIISGYEEERA